MERAGGLRTSYLWVPLAAGLALVSFPALASGKTGSAAAGAVRYHGAKIHVSAAGVINFRQLAKFDAQHPKALGPIQPGLMPEPQEKAEPNVRTTLPSPFPQWLSTHVNAPSVPSPSPVSNFIAQADAVRVGTLFSYIPPDTNGAVGQTKLMSTLNNNYRIQDRAGTVLGTVAMTTFWSAVGAAQPFDPKTYYDPYNNRFIAVATNGAQVSTSSVLYGISDTADPQGTWHLYSIDADSLNTTWADYPTVGFNKNVLVIGVNMFNNVGNAYAGLAKLYVVDYAALRTNGAAAGTPTVIPVSMGFTIQPAVTYSSTENTMYLVEHGASASATYYFYTLTGVGSPVLTPVGGAKTNPLGAWVVPGMVGPQTSGQPVDTGDSRILNAVFRNGNVYYTQAIGLGGSSGNPTRTAVQWVEVDTSGNFVQGGRIDDATATNANGGHWYAYPSIAVNSSSDVFLGFSEFQSNDFVDAAYAMRFGADAAGTMREVVTLKEGEGSYLKKFAGTSNRWGDYSVSQVDPADDVSFWTSQEYAGVPPPAGPGCTTTACGNWGTWWGKVLGSGAPPPPTTFPLGVTKNGTGAGSVTSSPAGIDCGATCSASFNVGSGVTLSQSHAADMVFAGWGGACSGTGACSVTMSAAQNVTATFNRKLTPPAIKCFVPNVIGKKLGAASATLRAKHCRVGKLRYVKSTTKKKGRVIGESPRAGSRLANKAKVNLTLGKGPKKR